MAVNVADLQITDEDLAGIEDPYDAATWSEYDGRWQGSAIHSANGSEYCLTRNDLRDALARHVVKGTTLLTQDAERHIVDVLWPSGEDVTIHSYEQVFNRAVWRHSK